MSPSNPIRALLASNLCPGYAQRTPEEVDAVLTSFAAEYRSDIVVLIGLLDKALERCVLRNFSGARYVVWSITSLSANNQLNAMLDQIGNFRRTLNMHYDDLAQPLVLYSIRIGLAELIALSD